MTTTKSTVPATVTWWQMFWMIMIQNKALGPYLKLWKGVSPYNSLNFIKISVLAIGGGFAMCFFAESFGGKESGYVFKIVGGVISLLWLIIGFANTKRLTETITLFRVIWNSEKIKLLSCDEFGRTMIDSIMTPNATFWAKKVIDLENTGQDRLPRGNRKKSSHMRKIDRYVTACLMMGLGRGLFTHKELVRAVFLLAEGKY